MSGFLNLGGDGGALGRTGVVRALNATFVVAAARPALVTYVVRVFLSDAASDGQVVLLSDTAAPPVTVLARSRLTGNAATVNQFAEFSLTGIVLPGHNVRIATTAVAGGPLFTFIAGSETVL